MKDSTADAIGCLFTVVVLIIVLGIGLGVTYWIATSNLPDWLKFAILR